MVLKLPFSYYEHLKKSSERPTSNVLTDDVKVIQVDVSTRRSLFVIILFKHQTKYYLPFLLKLPLQGILSSHNPWFSQIHNSRFFRGLDNIGFDGFFRSIHSVFCSYEIQFSWIFHSPKNLRAERSRCIWVFIAFFGKNIWIW